MLIVQGCEFMPEGDGYYRLHEPMRYLGKLAGVTAIDCHYSHRYFTRLARECHVLIIPFLHGWEFFPLIQHRRQHGLCTVLETNDFYQDLQPWNPIAPYWLDPDVEEEHKAYIQQVDAIQTSSARLADHWRNIARNVVVFPNQLGAIAPLAPMRVGANLTVGWAGSQGHLADWFELSATLQGWLQGNTTVKLACMSYALINEFFNLPKERYIYKPPGDLRDYLNFVRTFDIGIAPILPSEYNLCRSDVKFLEYASLGVAGIYASPGPYDDVVRHGETGFLYRNTSELLEALDALISSADLRQTVRLNAYNQVSGKRLLKDHIPTRLEFYESLVKNKVEVALDSELLASARQVDGDYYRLEKSEIELGCLQVISGRSDVTTVRRLEGLVSKAPYYVMARRGLGRQLNDIKEPLKAKEHLEEVLRIDPLNAGALGELGRSFFLLGRYQEALQSLNQAVTMNPWYVPGWEYLLRILSVMPEVDIRGAIADLDKHHPRSLKLKMLGLSLFKGEELAQELFKFLEWCERMLTRSEIEAGRAEIVATLIRLTNTGNGFEDLDRIFNTAHQIFPDCVALLVAHARLLHLNNQHLSAVSMLAAVGALYRKGERYKKEIGIVPDTYMYGLIGEHLEREDLFE